VFLCVNMCERVMTGDGGARDDEHQNAFCCTYVCVRVCLHACLCVSVCNYVFMGEDKWYWDTR